MTDQEARDERKHPVDVMAQDIRRVDGAHNLGAGALAQALYDLGYRKHPEPEWEYGTALRTSTSELWDPYAHPSRVAAEQAIATDNPEDRAPDEIVLVRRTPGTTAGPWEPVPSHSNTTEEQR